MDRENRKRRSSTRLKFGSPKKSNPGHEFKTVLRTARALAESERAAGEAIFKWSLGDENTALRDIGFHTNELMHVWYDQQRDFVQKLEQGVEELTKVNEGEKLIEAARNKVLSYDDKEKKIKREMKGFHFWRKGGDLRLLEHQLLAIAEEREHALRHLQDTKAEAQVVKMFRFRQAMQQISSAFKSLCQAGETIFDCQRQLSLLVPAVSSQDVRQMVYNGADTSRQMVEDLRSNLDMVNRGDLSRRRISAPPNFAPLTPPDDLSMPLSQLNMQTPPQAQRLYPSPPPPYSIYENTPPPSAPPLSPAVRAGNLPPTRQVRFHSTANFVRFRTP